MNGVLLDTHTFLWGLRDSSELSGAARDLLAGSPPVKHLSLASVWEMAVKLGLGKLSLPAPLAQTISQARQAGVQILPVNLPHVYRVETLPSHHRDPFDRLLVAQCLTESLPLVSRDAIFDRYGIPRIW